MLEGYVSYACTDDAGGEDPASTRARLRAGLSPGFSRRATVLGLLVGGVLRGAMEQCGGTTVYASAYGETRTLADFLDTFPHESPTLFQTSVHPSAVQQVMIERKLPIREYVPLAGGPCLAARALAAALLSPGDPVVLCGGEERGGWMADIGMASERSFAFALVLRKEGDASTLARLRLEPSGGDGRAPAGSAPGAMAFPAWFDLLHSRRNYDGPVSAEWRLGLEWT
jgi:hypothetical protein